MEKFSDLIIERQNEEGGRFKITLSLGEGILKSPKNNLPATKEDKVKMLRFQKESLLFSQIVESILGWEETEDEREENCQLESMWQKELLRLNQMSEEDYQKERDLLIENGEDYDI